MKFHTISGDIFVAIIDMHQPLDNYKVLAFPHEHYVERH